MRSRPAFGEVAEKLGDKLIYLTQPNLGGAGGFSRGMYEITGSPNSAHANVIVMDDDILCEPESVLRLNAFANMTVQPTIVGAQMLSLSNPQVLHVSAEREVLDEIKAGELTPGAKMGVDLIKKKQDPRFDAGWNGWWTCLLPAEIIASGIPSAASMCYDSRQNQLVIPLNPNNALAFISLAWIFPMIERFGSSWSSNKGFA